MTSSDSKTAEYLYKICVIGDASVGKTTAVTRFASGVFEENYVVTIGVQHTTHEILIEGAHKPTLTKLLVWDLGGQEKFSDVRPMFYTAAKGLILMFDMTNSESFDNLHYWIREAKRSIENDISLIIAGNKSDLPPHKVDFADADAFAKELGAEFVITSAKTGLNLGYLFSTIAKKMHEKALQRPITENSTIASTRDVSI